eukprot:symbB.v1.2.009691.t1/scaffold620.1/size179776/9
MSLPLICRSIFDPATGFNRLELAPISAASADQRKGRAGRLQNGLCLRLWAADESLRPEDAPAITEEDLTGVLLQLLDTGTALKDILSRLPWLDPPPLKSIEHASDVLRLLGAIKTTSEEEDVLTAHGRVMARLPLHPRLAHMVLKAKPEDMNSSSTVFSSIASLCALLEEERDVLQDWLVIKLPILIPNGELVPVLMWLPGYLH